MNIEEYTLKEIVDAIKTKQWKHKTKLKIGHFVKKVAPNKYAVDLKFILQSKEEAIDYKFVKRQVNKAKNGKKFSLDAVVVYFPKDVMIDGVFIPGGSIRLIDRTHGMVIDAHLGKIDKSAYVINFEKHLLSDEGNIWRVANLLNDESEEAEKQGLPDGAIKTEVHRLMDRRDKAGLDPTPSKEEREGFLRDYAQLTLQQYANYVSTHVKGGRTKTAIMHTPEECKAFHQDLINDSKNGGVYEGFYIHPVTHVAAWKTDVGKAMIQREVTIERKNKILMCFHSTSKAQTNDLETNKTQKAIRKKLDQLKVRFNIDEFDFCLMDY